MRLFYALEAVQLRSPFFWDMVPHHLVITAPSFETVLILEGQMSSLEDETTMLSQNIGHQSHSGISQKNVDC